MTVKNSPSESNKKTSGLGKSFFRIAPVCFMTWMTLGYITPVQAAVVVDIKQSQIPNVLANANGSITVNINSASEKGISHNKFTQFDVTNQGLVLNNSATNSTTTVAGVVAGNSNMAKGPAGLIINEVTSNRASKLNGMIEVAGQKANVIVANPSGITCDGCGFINTGRSTLTTGKVQIDNDTLTGVKVSSGTISIAGKGMKDNLSDYTSLLARSVNVNAEVAAKDLQVMTGIANNVTLVNNQLTDTLPVSSASYASGLDVSKLGGMYADKITLVSNQTGIGVSNRGLISATTDLTIDNHGTILNYGNIESKKTAALTSRDLSNRGSIASMGDLKITAGSTYDNDGGITQSKGLVQVNSAATSNYGGLIAGDSISIVSNRVSNEQSQSFVSKEQPALTGGIKATNNININTGELLSNYAGDIQSEAGNVSLVASRLSGSYGTISGKDVTLNGEIMNLSAVKLSASHDINLQAGSLTNSATTVINAANNLSMTSEKDHSNLGALYAGNDLSMSNAGDFVNKGTIAAKNNATISGKNINNYNNITANGNLILSSKNSINNGLRSTLTSGSNISLQAPTSLINYGNIVAVGTNDIQSKKINNYGYISK